MSETELINSGLFVGGLRNDLHPLKLVGLLCQLLRKFQVQVPKRNVDIHFKPSSAFAFIELQDVSSRDYILYELSSWGNVQNVFDLGTITFDPSDFHVGPRWTSSSKRHRSRSRSQSRRGKKNEIPVESSSSTVKISVSDYAGKVAGGTSPHPGPSRKQRKRDRLCSQEGHVVGRNTSRVSQQSESLTSQSESDTDSDDDLSRDVSALKVPSNSSSIVSTSKSKEKLNSQGQSPAYNPQRFQAGGVRRLTQEFNTDSVARSLSDRGIPSIVTGKTSITTSTTGLPLPAQVSVTTSTPDTGTHLALSFYRMGQLVGRETRYKEFKQGGKAHKDPRWLQEVVGKYVCGFLNSGEGGTLFFGVNDKGMVTGFDCPQSKEDHIRLMTDEALKSIEPPIFTDAYSVRFVPVMEQNGQLSETQQVLEITVKEIRHPKHLYLFRGKAFLRRDGSLQGPLSARQVQEWTRKQLERENSSSLLKSQLHEMTSQLEKEREKNAKMQQQLTELEGHLSEVILENRKSKICAIM